MFMMMNGPYFQRNVILTRTTLAHGKTTSFSERTNHFENISEGEGVAKDMTSQRL